MKLSGKLYLLSGLFFAIYLVAAIPAYFGFVKLDPSKSTLVEYLSGIQSHMQADMMHDALRGDVLQAILITSSGNAAYGTEEESLKDVADHAK